MLGRPLIAAECSMSRLRRWLCQSVSASLVAASAAMAQPATAPTRAGPANGMATRSVSLYLEKERALQDALESRDRAEVERIVADDFQQRSAARADPVDRSQWLRQALAAPASPRIVRELSLLEIDDLVIASFLLDSAHGSMFVVDVWRASTGKLLSRQLSRAADASPKPHRPSGRE
jgi:hypothetical protein